MTGAAARVKVTGTVCGEFVAFVLDTVIVAVWVPEERPEILTAATILEPDCVVVSQELLSLTLQFSVLPPVLLTDIV